MPAEPTRRELFLAAAAAAVACRVGTAAPAVKAFENDEATVEQLQEAIKSGKATSKSITQAYLDRIEAIDRKGPALNSVIEVNPDALAIAEACDKHKGQRGPLHGQWATPLCRRRRSQRPGDDLACRTLEPGRLLLHPGGSGNFGGGYSSSFGSGATFGL